MGNNNNDNSSKLFEKPCMRTPFNEKASGDSADVSARPPPSIIEQDSRVLETFLDLQKAKPPQIP